MHKPSAVLIYGGIGITSFGVAYDSGYLGSTDGQDHSAVFSIPSGVTGTSSDSRTSYTVVNNITGDEVVAPLPSRKSPQQQT
jgi:hypothetical protein